GPSRPGWVTRFWAAKEAVAKAAGTGLGGRPHEFAVQRVEGDRLLVTAGEGASSSWTQTEVGTEPEPYAVAWTSPAASGLALEHRDSHRRGQPDDT
ncbi:MAG: 4'-phosphopantetheinyl transferase superfamily protein, partial [Pseudonocardiales bacterium]|nr:4'-phosphopantetheinyl transferase superfamily protein [Pseudonocardiales bacterium]